MYKLTFLPFVGKNYNDGGMFGKRIMALGDSHYGSVPQPNITRDVLAMAIFLKRSSVCYQD